MYISTTVFKTGLNLNNALKIAKKYIFRLYKFWRQTLFMHKRMLCMARKKKKKNARLNSHNTLYNIIPIKIYDVAQRNFMIVKIKIPIFFFFLTV